MDYRAELRACRGRLGLTQEEMAALLGIDAGTVNRYERGKHPVPEPIVRLARALVLMQEWTREA